MNFADCSKLPDSTLRCPKNLWVRHNHPLMKIPLLVPRMLLVAVPVLCAATPIGHEGRRPAPVGGTGSGQPPPHAVDLWMGQGDSVGVDTAWARAAERERFATFPPKPVAAVTPAGVGDGFLTVGSVAVLEGDECTVASRGTGFGIGAGNMECISSRFIAAFGDDYDQIAVFLSFVDRLTPTALAYQQAIKNTTKGIGIDLFDFADRYGSRSGRLETVLNMKRITIYGRDAAEEMDNDLYSVWAQEAAHRWIVYFRFQREGDGKVSEDLLGRQKAHWARGVQADASFMDGWSWKENGDGTFTPVERGKRYGALDQYGMGLRTADEVPPFFLLTDIRNERDELVDKAPLSRTGRYTAKKLDLSIKDIVRVHGKREPSSDPAAQDLRMGVVLVVASGTPATQKIGEAFRIDNTRRLWTDFYNTAGDGRGKVCTELLRPCRGEAFTYADAQLSEAPSVMPKDGVVAPGEAFVVKITVTNVGTVAGRASVRAATRGWAEMTKDLVDSPVLAPGKSATLTFDGRVAGDAAVGEELYLDLSAPGRLGPSKAALGFVLGLKEVRLDNLEGSQAPTAWQVNPDGTDAATSGAWELGNPERSIEFEFTMQPQGAFSGSHAFVTGAPDGQNVKNGATTLQSPEFSLAGLSEPRLSFRVYFVSADFDNEVLIPGAGDTLRILASPDGKAWSEIDRIEGMGLGWQRRIVNLSERLPPGAMAAPSLRFRFVADNAGVVQNNVVEAVIDDVGVFSAAVAAVNPGVDATPPLDMALGGCDCRVGQGRDSRPSRWLVIGLGHGGVVLLAWRRLRRRHRRIRE